MRAVAQDKVMASLLGINIDSIISLTFIIGSALRPSQDHDRTLLWPRELFHWVYRRHQGIYRWQCLAGSGDPGAMFGGIFLGFVESMGASYISSEYKDAYAFPGPHLVC